MNLEHLKPELPDYLLEAVAESSAAMEESGNIATARREVQESLEQITQAIAEAEAQLGDLEAESRLRRRPDAARIAKIEERLDKLRTEHTKLAATEKSLEQRAHQQDEAITRAYGTLNSARRKLGMAMLIPLNEALEQAVRPLQDLLEVVREINHFVDFSEYFYPLIETLVPRFGGQRHLIFHGTHYSREGLPRDTCEIAVRWKEALSAADQTLCDLRPVSERCRHAIENRKEKAAEERMRADRLKLRVI